MSTLEQEQYDEEAMKLLQEVITAGRAGKNYKELMPILAAALAKSPKTVQYIKSLTVNIVEGQ